MVACWYFAFKCWNICDWNQTHCVLSLTWMQSAVAATPPFRSKKLNDFYDISRLNSLAHSKEPNVGIRRWNVALIFVYKFRRFGKIPPKQIEMHALTVQFSQLLSRCERQNRNRRKHITPKKASKWIRRENAWLEKCLFRPISGRWYYSRMGERAKRCCCCCLCGDVWSQQRHD